MTQTFNYMSGSLSAEVINETFANANLIHSEETGLTYFKIIDYEAEAIPTTSC